MSLKALSLDLIPTLQNRDAFFEKITQRQGAGTRIISQYVLLNILALVYGVVMGVYHGVPQAIAAGAKVTVLFSLVLLICFPAFFIIQLILGSKLKLYQMISIILAGFCLTSAIMVSFIPIIIFFLLTGSNYYFLQLLHIGIAALSGVFGMKVMIDALRFSCEKKSVYPQTGVVVFRFWVVIMAFVGIQLAWNLRPFLGDRDQPFELFRSYEGNFYAALIYSFKQLAASDTLTTPGAANTNSTLIQPAPEEGIASDSLLEYLMKQNEGGDNTEN